MGRDIINHSPSPTAFDVSIHAPAWGATPDRRLVSDLPGVSIHAPAWGATGISHHTHPLFLVSIHAPAWGATRMDGGIRQDYRVSIHAPAWGATTSQAAAPPSSHCFNPRARVGRDDIDYAIVYDTVTFQSTRPRGARLEAKALFVKPQQFQSTRPRGARRLRRPEIGRVRVVSIHAPAWGATRHGARDNAHRVVSIHAPAWGATTTRWWRSPTVLSFNPRARVGRDGLFPGLRARQDAFQSTRPRGARPGRPAGKSVSPGFQSTRPRGARREVHAGHHPRAGVSIHAPAWGATVVALHYHTVSFEVSIHAPAWGATRLWRSAAWWETVSIHAPAWGATQVLQRLLWALLVSIHAPAWGATPAGAGGWLSAGGFNPRARVGRDVVSVHPFAGTPWFQSTRPRGARPSSLQSSRHSSMLFQSTRPRGARPVQVVCGAARVTVSIHAPAWGATSGAGRRCGGCHRFNPRARVGRDASLQRATGAARSFNPRARVGRDDPGRPTSPPAGRRFNPRARVGRDARQHSYWSSSGSFQSTRPRGARPAVASLR